MIGLLSSNCEEWSFNEIWKCINLCLVFWWSLRNAHNKENTVSIKKKNKCLVEISLRLFFTSQPISKNETFITYNFFKKKLYAPVFFFISHIFFQESLTPWKFTLKFYIGTYFFQNFFKSIIDWLKFTLTHKLVRRHEKKS